MQSVTCRACGNRVLAEKYSPTHTSIQWLADAETACPEFRRHAESGARSAWITCTALRASVDALVDAGELPLTSRSYPTPGRLD